MGDKANLLNKEFILLLAAAKVKIISSVWCSGLQQILFQLFREVAVAFSSTCPRTVTPARTSPGNRRSRSSRTPYRTSSPPGPCSVRVLRFVTIMALMWDHLIHQGLAQRRPVQRPSVHFLQTKRPELFGPPAAVLHPCQEPLSGEKRSSNQAQTTGCRHGSAVPGLLPSHAEGEARGLSRRPRPEPTAPPHRPSGRTCSSSPDEDLRPQAPDGRPEEAFVLRTGEHERGRSAGS